MKVRVLFFGATADAAGSHEIQLEIPAGNTVGKLVEDVCAKHSRLTNMQLLFAVNEQYVDAGRELCDGDDLALFTPVSGG